MVSQDVFDRVGKTLRSLEGRHEVRVLYACESGSRRGALLRAIVITMCVSSMFIRGIGISQLRKGVM